MHSRYQFSFVSARTSLVVGALWNSSPVHCIQGKQSCSRLRSFHPLPLALRRETTSAPPFWNGRRENSPIHFPKEIFSIFLYIPSRWLLNHIYHGSILNFHSLKLLLTTNFPLPPPHVHYPTSACLELSIGQDSPTTDFSTLAFGKSLKPKSKEN